MLFKKINFHYGIQISLAMAISIALGYYFKLNNPIAAGVVTLATIQNTKRETLKIAFRRFIAFLLMLILSVATYNIVGFNVVGFFVFVIIFSSAISYFKAVEVLSSNIVMSTAFLVAKNTSLAVIQNEFIVFIVGVGIGVFVNVMVPVFSNNFVDKKIEIDEIHKKIYDILFDRFRGIYKIEDKEVDKKQAYDKDFKLFVDANILLDNYIVELKNHNGNMLLYEEDYYIEYFEMRKLQMIILQDIWEHSKKLAVTLEESMIIAGFLKEIRLQFHETNTNEKLLERSEELLDFYRKKELPKTRMEFEVRANLYNIFNKIVYLLEIKYEFVKNLSKDDIKKYWNGGRWWRS